MSPEALFLGGERRRLTRFTVSPRLAARATASSEVEEGSGFDLKLLRDWGLDLCWNGTSISLNGDWFEARRGRLVLGLGAAAKETKLVLSAVVSSRGVGC
jgi:hypothetical protein